MALPDRGSDGRFVGGGGGGEDAAVLRVILDNAGVSEGLASLANGAVAMAKRFADAASSVAEFAARGDRVDDVMSALTVGIGQADRALDGMVGKLDLAIAANRATASGLDLTDTQFRALAVTAKQFADRTGVDAAGAMEQLTGAIIRGNARGLKPFGIEAKNSADAVAELERKSGSLSLQAVGITDNVDKLNASWGHMVDTLAVAVNRQEGVGRAIGGVATAVRGLDHVFEGLFFLLDKYKETFPSMSDRLHKMAREMQGAATAAHSLESQIDSLANSEFFSRTETFRAIRAGLRSGEGSPADVYGPLAGGAPFPASEAEAPEGGGGSGGGHTVDPLFARVQREVALYAQRNQLEERDVQMRVEAGRRRLAASQEETERVLHNNARQNAAWEHSHRESQRREREMLRGHDDGRRSDARTIEMQRQKLEAYAQVTSAIMAKTAAAITQGATAGQVAQTVLATFLNQIAQMAAVEAVKNTAKGLADLAEFNYGSAAMHFGAAALWGTIGVGAGVAASAVSPDLAGSGGARTAAAGVGGSPMRSRGTGSDEGGPLYISIQVQAPGGVVADSQLRKMAKHMREARRRNQF